MKSNKQGHKQHKKTEDSITASPGEIGFFFSPSTTLFQLSK